MIAVMDAIFIEPFLVIPFLSGILWNIGPILIGAAVWRSGTLWKWGGLLLIIAGLIYIPAFLDQPALVLVGAIIGGTAKIALGISLFQAVRRPVVQGDVGAADQ